MLNKNLRLIERDNMITKEMKTLHDNLLKDKPEGASHDEASCPLCAYEEGGPMGEFSQEEVDAAIALAIEEATKPLKDEITKLTASEEEVAIAARIEEATQPLVEQIADIQSKLDLAVLEAQTAKDALTSTLAYLDQINTEKEIAERMQAVKTERLAKIAEVATFPEDFVAENADRWAAMDDETFATTLESFRLVASKPSTTITRDIPVGTAMTAASQPNGSANGMDLIKQAHNDFVLGTDYRNLDGGVR